MMLEGGHAALRIKQVTEQDCLRGTRLRTSRHDLAVHELPTLIARLDLRALNALNAVSALLHHSPRANGDIRILLHLLRLGDIEVQVEVVEPAHLPWTIVRAIAGPHTA